MSVRRDEIVRVAGDLFAKKGFLGTTVREIADDAGILSGSLYHYFDSKEALALEVVHGYYETLLQRFGEIVDARHGPTETFSGLIGVSCRGILESPSAVALVRNSGDYLLALPRFAEVARINGQIRSIWLRVFEAGAEEGFWSEDIDPAFLYRAVRDVLSGTVRWWRASGPYTIDQMAARYSEMFLYGMVRSAESSPAGKIGRPVHRSSH